MENKIESKIDWEKQQKKRKELLTHTQLLMRAEILCTKRNTHR